jgi:site-specific DNA-methyltransferase (adenine-specific)
MKPPVSRRPPAAKISLLEGDCLPLLAAMPAAGFDLVVTSPPYNLGIAYSRYDDNAGRGEFLAWCRRWAAEVRRVMAPGASFFLNLGASPRNPLLPHQLLLALTEAPDPLFTLQNTFHWIKSITVETPAGRPISAGHFKPIQSKRFVNDCHEYVFHLTADGDVDLDRRAAGVPYADKSNIARWRHTGGADLRCRGNNWFIPYETIQSRDKDRPHPATFPPALPALCILLHGRGSDTRMLDPFLGIGSSAIAALRHPVRSFTGIELDPAYLATTRERIDAELAERAARLDLFP